MLIIISIMNLLLLVFNISLTRKIYQNFSGSNLWSRKFFTILLSLLFCGQFFVSTQVIAATNTTPPYIIYEGNLLDPGGIPMQGDFTFRFSLWTSSDFESDDVNVDGFLNETKLDYMGWKSYLNTDLTLNGRFSFELGKQEPIDYSIFDRMVSSQNSNVNPKNPISSSSVYAVSRISCEGVTLKFWEDTSYGCISSGGGARSGKSTYGI